MRASNSRLSLRAGQRVRAAAGRPVVFLGTADLERARAFCDPVMKEVGLRRTFDVGFQHMISPAHFRGNCLGQTEMPTRAITSSLYPLGNLALDDELRWQVRRSTCAWTVFLN